MARRYRSENIVNWKPIGLDVGQTHGSPVFEADRRAIPFYLPVTIYLLSTSSEYYSCYSTKLAK